MPTFPSLARFETRMISYLVISTLSLMGMGFDHINEKTTFILMEIWVFPNLTGILRLFFKHREINNCRKGNKNRERKSLGFRPLKRTGYLLVILNMQCSFI